MNLFVWSSTIHEFVYDRRTDRQTELLHQYSHACVSSQAKRMPMRYMSCYVADKYVFRADLKASELSVGSRRRPGSEFQAIGPATENARRSNLLRRCGSISRWRLAERTKPLTTGNIRRLLAAVHKVGCLEALYTEDIGGLTSQAYTGLTERYSANTARIEVECITPRSNLSVPQTTV